jgi:peroxiredoxin Q/BCP
MRKLALFSTILALFTTAARAADLKAGDPCPAFSMVGTDGVTYTLDSFKGKQAFVIAWFPKAFTGGCTKECKSFRENGKVLRDFDVAYFTASCDTPELNKDFAKSLELDYPILSDPSREAAKALGVLGKGNNATRWTFYVGKDGNILFIDKGVQTASHGQDVASKLKELGVAAK